MTTAIWKTWNVAIRVLISWALLLVSGSSVSAQTPCTANCTVTVNKPFQVLFEAPTTGGAATGFRVYLDGAKLGADIPASAGTVTVNGVLVATAGAHTLEVSAFNAIGEGAKTQPLTLTASQGVPGTPGNLRIQVVFTVAQDGSISVRVVGVEQDPIKP